MLKTMLGQYIYGVKCEETDFFHTFKDARTGKEIKMYAGGKIYYDNQLLTQFQVFELLQTEAKEPYRFTIDIYA